MLVANISELSKAEFPKAAILSLVELSGVEVFNSDLLVATFVRPEKTSGGIYRPDAHKEEDKYQGKVGLILAMGPEAFAFNKHSSAWAGRKGEIGDWIVFNPSDGWAANMRGVNSSLSQGLHIRFVASEHVRAIVDDPQKFY